MYLVKIYKKTKYSQREIFYMATIIFTDQVFHNHETLATRIDTLLAQFDSIQVAKYVKEEDEIVDFKGQVSIKGINVLTETMLYESGIARYDNVLPNFTDTSALGIPSGASKEQPHCSSPGFIRFNTEKKVFEGYDGTEWTRFDTTNLVDNPEHAEQFTINPDSYWEFDTWCLFGGNTDARKRSVQLYAMDSFNGSVSQGMWVTAGLLATIAIKDKRFVRIYNKHVNSLQFFVKIS